MTERNIRYLQKYKIHDGLRLWDTFKINLSKNCDQFGKKMEGNEK